jgi:SAM-dependent methyltransferase
MSQSKKLKNRIKGSRLLWPARKAWRSLKLLRARLSGSHFCGVCGFTGKPRESKVLWEELSTTWGLSAEWVGYFDAREGSGCVRCGASLRSSHLAKTLASLVNQQSGATDARTLMEACETDFMGRWRVAEINSAGHLHGALARLRHLQFSEYGSKDPRVPSENLLCLTYPDQHFDLVITSETLEHVPDVDGALKEICRVLKPGGFHVFTVPIIDDGRATRQRAAIENGKLRHILPPTHHGNRTQSPTDLLVFYEYGMDFLDRCSSAGFTTTVHRDAANPAILTLVSRK